MTKSKIVGVNSKFASKTGERVATDSVTLNWVPLAASAHDEHDKYLGARATVTGDFSCTKVVCSASSG